MSACRHEPRILEAATRDAWSDEMLAHVAGCEDCIAAAAVAPWMQRFATMSDRTHRLPDASIVYLKARLMQRGSDIRRVSRPLDVLQMVAYLVVAGGWAGMLTWKWPAIERWLHGLTPSGILLQSTAGVAESLSASFIAIVVLLASMTVMLALHTIMAEE